MNMRLSKIEELLDRVFDELQTVEDGEKYEEEKRQFIFHMTDWIDDLQDLIELYEQERYEGNAAQTIAGFLYHAVPHLNAAGRLLLNHIPDNFTDDQK
jgi:hypothetical protein